MSSEKQIVAAAAAENNPKSDFSLLSPRFIIGPFTLCFDCRKKSEVVDLGPEGCKAMIFFCGKCRSNNKTISYKMRFPPKASEATTSGTANSDMPPSKKQAKEGEEEPMVELD